MSAQALQNEHLEAYVAPARKLYGNQADRFLMLYSAKTDKTATAVSPVICFTRKCAKQR